MHSRRLRIKHDVLFRGTKYFIPAKQLDRSQIERRMFFYFAARYPCYKDPADTRIFRKKARDVLFEVSEVRTKEEILAEDLKNRVLFTRKRIRQMSDKQVDAYLMVLGYNIQGSPAMKRKALWEYYRAGNWDLPQNTKLTKRKIGRLRKLNSYEDNHYVLMDIILHFPTMGWREFEENFGELMPSVTQNSFYVTRHKLRKIYGFELPRLKPGAKPISQIAARKILQRSLALDEQELAEKVVRFKPTVPY